MRERERTRGLSQSVRVVCFFPTYVVSCKGPCAPKEKWHRKGHIIIIILVSLYHRSRLPAGTTSNAATTQPRSSARRMDVCLRCTMMYCTFTTSSACLCHSHLTYSAFRVSCYGVGEESTRLGMTFSLVFPSLSIFCLRFANYKSVILQAFRCA